MVELRQVNEMKKTTIEIPDPLFLKAKIRAARDGLSMRDLFLRALQTALETPSLAPQKKRVDFPLIRASRQAPRLTFDQVASVLNSDEGLL